MTPTIDEPLFDLAPDALRCPHETFARLRTRQPVSWSDRLGCWVVTRYEDIVRILHDTDVFSSTVATGPGSATPLARQVMDDTTEPDDLRKLARRRATIAETPVLLFTDPPLHTRQRKLVNRAFTPRRVAAMEGRIRAIAEELVGAFAPAGRVELNSQFGVLLPMFVIADALGVPRDEAPSFKRWSDAFVMSNGNPNMTRDDVAHMLRLMNEFYDYFSDQIEQREAAPRDDLLSDIVHARIDGSDRLKPTEMLGMLTQFLVAGNETTAKLIASAVIWLVREPALMSEVRAAPDLLPGLVEEVLRLDAPVQGLFRVAKADGTIGDVPIEKGAFVFLVYASGNRDGCQFQDPDNLELGRVDARPHLALGQGDHFCLGASLARAEARIGLEILLGRLEDIQLTVPLEELEYEPSVALRGLRRLPLTFRPR